MTDAAPRGSDSSLLLITYRLYPYVAVMRTMSPPIIPHTAPMITFVLSFDPLPLLTAPSPAVVRVQKPPLHVSSLEH